MIMRFLAVVLIALVLTTACGAQQIPPVAPELPNTPTQVQAENTLTDEPAFQAETATPNCLGDGISTIGQSIADDYESASYERVMTWFCNGAEFEDILVALETEAQTDTSADEMLKMLADGFSWDEIWQLVGLTN